MSTPAPPATPLLPVEEVEHERANLTTQDVKQNPVTTNLLSNDDVLSPHGGASPFARVSLVAYVLLIVYASWYPFSGWQADALVTLADALRQWPRYWTRFDAITNVIGYIPLGLLIVFSFYPWRRRALSVVLATLAGIALTVTVECVQHFLPSRVTSVLDILTNSAGTLIGALIGVWLIPPILERSRLQWLQKEWLRQESSREMLVLGLWTAAQIYPHAYLFGLGQVLPTLSLWINELFELDIDLGAMMRNGQDLNTEQYLLAETVISAFNCTGALLICLSLFNRHAPKIRLSFFILLAALTVKSLASALLFKPEYAFVWLTPGAQGGLLISAFMVYGLSFAPVLAQKRLAILTISISLVMVNLVPGNPYFVETLQGWVQGKFLNFNGVAQFVSVLWPFLALSYLFKKNRRAWPVSAQSAQSPPVAPPSV